MVVLDNENAELILQLELQDLHELLDKQKGKQKLGEVTDFEHSINLSIAEAESALTALRDTNFARSISRAVITDADALRQLEQLDVQTLDDRDLAHRLAGNQAPPRNDQSGLRATPLTEDVISQITALNLGSSIGGG